MNDRTPEEHTAKEDAVEALAIALREVFGDEKGQRFVDVSRIPLLCASVINTNKAIEEINKKLDDKFVTKEAFDPVRKIVYGVVALMLTAVVTALLALVIMNKGS